MYKAMYYPVCTTEGRSKQSLEFFYRNQGVPFSLWFPNSGYTYVKFDKQGLKETIKLDKVIVVSNELHTSWFLPSFAYKLSILSIYREKRKNRERVVLVVVVGGGGGLTEKKKELIFFYPFPSLFRGFWIKTEIVT